MGTNAIDEWKFWLKDGWIVINEKCTNDWQIRGEWTFFVRK
jgi:hypothetical protein